MSPAPWEPWPPGRHLSPTTPHPPGDFAAGLGDDCAQTILYTRPPCQACWGPGPPRQRWEQTPWENLPEGPSQLAEAPPPASCTNGNYNLQPELRSFLGKTSAGRVKQVTATPRSYHLQGRRKWKGRARHVPARLARWGLAVGRPLGTRQPVTRGSGARQRGRTGPVPTGDTNSRRRAATAAQRQGRGLADVNHVQRHERKRSMRLHDSRPKVCCAGRSAGNDYKQSNQGQD